MKVTVEKSKTISTGNSSGLNFIRWALDLLKDELQLYCNAVEQNPFYASGKAVADVFHYNERAILGLFVNSIVRNDADSKYVAVQEFCVKDNKSKKNMRADLLVIEDSSLYYLIEAKHYYSNEKKEAKYSDDETIDFLMKEIGEQARKYCAAEPKFYNNETLLISLVFETISFTHQDKYMRTVADYNSTKENYFYTFYSAKEITDNGLAVYGLIENMKTKNI